MFKAYLIPTRYEQPRPIDGKYSAVVYRTHAEFEYQGYKVIANISPGAMNADGNTGDVTVNGESVYISWIGSANSTSEYKLNDEKVSCDSKQFIATLTPLEFGQRRPFHDVNEEFGYKGIIFSDKAEFGVLDKYKAVIDGHLKPSVLAAPCTILPMKEDPTKCIIELDDATVFMAKRYGPSTYVDLVEKTVNELQKLIQSANAG